MATLIVGGLIIVGIAALVGLVVVLRSDEPTARRNSRAVNASGANTTAAGTDARPAPAAPLTQSPETMQTVPTAIAQPVQNASSVSELDTESLSLQSAPPLRPLSDQDLYQPAQERQITEIKLNGQFRELATELRSLYHEAEVIRQRLSNLNEMVAHIEQQQENYLNNDH